MEVQSGVSFRHRPFMYDCVQCNEDGQFVICLENNVHIMIPILTGTTSKSDNYKHVGLSLPQLVEPSIEKAVLRPESIETSYALEEGFRCAKWSPSRISPSKSSFLLVITTKHRVLLYQDSAEKAGTTDWQLFTDLTDQIVDSFAGDSTLPITPHYTLYGDWSKRLISDPLAINPILFALSNKAGEINIWSYIEDIGVNHELTVKAHKGFVNLLDWTDWINVEKSQYIAHIVSTSTDGTVALTSVRLTLLEDDNTVTCIEKVEAERLFTWFEDEPTITTLAKITYCKEDDENCLKIALSRGGSVQCLCMIIGADGTLQAAQETFVAYNLEHSALGLSSGNWLTGTNFQCYTVEGEGLNLIFDKHGRLEVDEQAHSVLNKKLLQRYTQQWMDLQLDAEEDSILTTTGATPYLWGAVDGPNHLYTALFYSLKPDVDVYYRYESDETVAFAFILQKDRNDQTGVINLIQSFTNDPYFFFRKSIRGALWELLEFFLGDNDVKSFVDLIKELSKYIEEASKSSQTSFVESIYCDRSTISARILINIKFLLENYRPCYFEEDLTSACEEAKLCLQSNFLYNVFNYALETLEDRSEQWTDEDITMVLLLCDFALTLKDRKLLECTAAIYSKLQDEYPSIEVQEELIYAKTFKADSESSPPERKPREKCPVCEAQVYILSDSIAQCDTGHFWELCSLTQKVLSTPNTRKCFSCGAKALPAGNNDANTLVNFIVRKCTKCIFCGSDLILQRF
ncbi:hypothetical protein BDF20DRAFT_886883 [Mycotypha africana]|uniref:uncharacterized protein n=1 Tax=Mycotypha africana TaxID=64632 RepID=UPI0023002686|nr:uncharacterized protein BDF20DRAFT_886883 [Mycotypha africana]KAI8971862.1 hypothetical protein BDF20DRAFT_886883 [Mycotypha africana]